MTQPAKPFLEEAAALLGPRGLIRDPDLLAPWLTDWRGRYTGRALALAAPAPNTQRPDPAFWLASEPSSTTVSR